MNEKYRVIEIAKDNEHQYLQKVVELEEYVLESMEKEGKVGQLFTTGEDGIREYIETATNHVMIAVKNDDSNELFSAAYITQGQIPFTYNDITKYFKYGAEYQDYVKSQYSKKDFNDIIRRVYIEKINAYRYARDCILKYDFSYDLKKLDEKDKNIELLKKIKEELENPENQFHEKSKIRENINIYMSQFIKSKTEDIDNYEKFYWVNFEYLMKNLGNETQTKSSYEAYDSTISAYDEILKYQEYKIYDSKHCKDISKYYGANTDNTIELDTYITHPNNRESGVARVLVLEGLKRSLARVLKNSNSNKIYIVSTLHEDNLSSKYVSEFFGLKDYLFVNRRKGRDRQVHICGIEREKISEYLDKMEKKIAVLYKRNPNNIAISDKERIEILTEQIQYEEEQLNNLKKAKYMDSGKRYTGYLLGKQSKIDKYNTMINEVKSKSIANKGKEEKNNSGNEVPEL